MRVYYILLFYIEIYFYKSNLYWNVLDKDVLRFFYRVIYEKDKIDGGLSAVTPVH